MTHDFVLLAQVNTLYAEYASYLDEERFDEWLAFFTEDAQYRLVPRENYDAGRPLATMSFDGRAMIKDRIYGVQNTLFHAPYYQRHIIGCVRVLKTTDDEIETQAHYVVIRTKRDGLSEVFNAGRYVDKITREGEALRFREKICVFDSELIPNSIIYPI